MRQAHALQIRRGVPIDRCGAQTTGRASSDGDTSNQQYGTLNASKSGKWQRGWHGKCPTAIPPRHQRQAADTGAIVRVRSLRLKRLNPYGISFTSAEKLMTAAVHLVIHD